jgi:hypothetical protein
MITIRKQPYSSTTDMDMSMLWEKKLAQWIADICAGADTPARLALWDGHSMILEPSNSPPSRCA